MVSLYTSMALGALLLISCSALATAVVHTVGDSTGWITGFDYSTWTGGKNFSVGDSLVFNYAPGTHTVNEVNEADYKACSTTKYLTTDKSGTTTIPLKTAGTHYFICGIPGHCTPGGMKFFVSVSKPGAGSSTTPGAAPATPSTTPSTTTGGSGTKSGAAVGTVLPVAATMVAGALVVGMVLV